MGIQTSYDTTQGSACVHEPRTFGQQDPADPLRRLLEKETGDREHPQRHSGRVTLPSGRTIDHEPQENGDDAVTIRSADGQVVLTVTLTESGPLLRFDAAQLQLQSQGRVAIDCDEYHVRAAKRIVEQTRGDKIAQVGGDATLVVAGGLSTQARQTEIRSVRGDVRVKANDDVRLNGERVKLNC